MGRQLIRSQLYRDGKLAAKPGKDYVAVAAKAGEYHLFPEHPEGIYNVLRHAWVLVRRRRPHVILVEGL